MKKMTIELRLEKLRYKNCVFHCSFREVEMERLISSQEFEKAAYRRDQIKEILKNQTIIARVVKP